MIKKKNIYIIGNILGAYRSQSILSILLNSTKYTVNFNNFTVSDKSSKTLHTLLKAIDVFIVTVLRLYFLIRADIVFILPMNNNKFFQILTAKFFRKKIVSDFYISYYDTRIIDRNWAGEKSFMARVYRMYDMTLLKTKKVFFLNQSEADYYTKIVGNDNKFIVNSAILPLCLEPRPKAQLNYFNHRLTKIINICWWGTFIPLHGLDKIIEAARILKESKFEFKVHLFGDSKENGLPFQKMIEEKGLTENMFLYYDYTFLNGRLEAYLLENCDLALGAFGDSLKAKTVITNKVIDALSMKIPVMTCHSSGVEEYFEDETDLFLCKNNPDEMAAIFVKIISCSSDRICNMVENASEKFNADFSYNAFKVKFLKELETI
jgi:glycosyltransferase involved in cell wall biosynthesis